MKAIKKRMAAFFIAVSLVLGMAVSPMSMQEVFADFETPIEMTIIDYPTRYLYQKGETLSLDGLKVEVNFGAGVIEYYGADRVTVIGSVDMNKIGDQTVVIGFTGGGVTVYDYFYIYISDTATPTPAPAARTLESIYIVDYPKTTNYRVGDVFSLAGISVMASYSDGSYEYLGEGNLTIDNYPDMSKAGTYNVTLSYTVNGVKKTANMYAYVYAESQVPQYDQFTPGGTDIIDVNNNTSSSYVMLATSLSSKYSSASAWTRKGYIDRTLGDKYIVPDYLSTDYVDVIFVDKNLATDVPNLGKVYDVVFTLNESVTRKTNLSVFRSTIQGSVTEFKKTSTSKDATYRISGSQIHVYTQYSGTFGIAYTTNSGKVKTVKFTNYPTNYNDFPDIYVQAGEYLPYVSDAYRDNDEFLGWYNGASKWNFDNNRVNSNLTLSAKWKSNWNNGTTTAVTAKELTSISFSKAPTKSFYAGDKFVCDGTLVAYYSDNTSGNVNAGAFTTTTPDMSTVGTKTVTVSYTYNNVTKSTSYDITVLAKPAATTTTPVSQTIEDDDDDEVVVAPPAAIKSLTSRKAKNMTVNWNWNSSADGYQIVYSTTSNFATSTRKTIYVEKNTFTFKKLKSKKTYYVKMRSFIRTDDGTVFSAWSAKKKVTVK